ncbi:MAG: hypothetical protein J6Z01_03020 [Bacteroidales bacterium]|nr:hypothetical protein [Bacteroidales bacterium]
MQIIKEDEYVKITFDEETLVLGTKWKPTSFDADVSDDYVREVINVISDALASTQADYYLADQTNRGIVYTEEMQKWVLKKLMEGGEKAKLKKCAVVQSVDFFVGLSNEQLLKGAVTDIAYKCFSSRREAIEWLGVKDNE